MGELIRCRECGHRVMYKPRTHKSESAQLASLSMYPKLTRSCTLPLRDLEGETNVQVQFEAR